MSIPGFDIKNMTSESLSTLQPNQMIQLVLALQGENEMLKKSCEEEISKKYDTRLEQIERDINLNSQYIRRDTIEVSGIPLNIDDDDIETEVLRILKLAKAKVGNKLPGPFDVQASHRKNAKGVVIVKFVNRKFATAALVNSRNLKDVTVFKPEHDDDDNKQIYINQSLCREFHYLHYAVRLAKKNGEIYFYRVRNGIMYVQKADKGRFFEISHVNDLESNGITVPVRRY